MRPPLKWLLLLLAVGLPLVPEESGAVEVPPALVQEGKTEAQKTGALTPLHPTPLPKAAIPPSLLKQYSTNQTVLLEQTGTLAEGDASFNDGSLYDEYFFQGEAGQIVKITLDSEVFDTYLLLESPAGERIATNDDSGDGTNAQIVVQLPESGQYRVLVNALDETGRGNYRLLAEQGTLVELQQAELLTEAEAAYREARSLYNQSQFRDALGKYERALELYRDIGDQAVEIRILNSLGDTSWWLGDFPQALSYAEASLNLSRELGNASGEAEALRDIGDVYDSLGDYQEALEVG
jgi:tetratricopeptide (TPR) repeat protein